MYTPYIGTFDGREYLVVGELDCTKFTGIDIPVRLIAIDTQHARTRYIDPAVMNYARPAEAWPWQ